MSKNFTVEIGKEIREIRNKVYYLSNEDKINTIDIFNKFLENVDYGMNESEEQIEEKLKIMARAVLNNSERNKICDEHEAGIVRMINDLLENIEVGDSFTIESIGKLNWNYSDQHLFNTVVKRLMKHGMLEEKRMAKNTYRNIYIKVYTRIK